MDGGGLADRAVRPRFQQNVDERAALERLFVEPSIKNIENRKKPGLRAGGAALDFGFEPCTRPYRFSPIEKRDREFDLGLEVAVKASLGATGLGEDRINSNLVDTVP